MTQPLNTLPGEGSIKSISYICFRRKCELCQSPATYKHTWLLKDARANPYSKAFSQDNVSDYEDLSVYSCTECKSKITTPDGYVKNKTIPASEKYADHFLYWEEIKEHEKIREDG